MKVWQYTLIGESVKDSNGVVAVPINILLFRELQTTEEVEYQTLLKVVSIEEVEINDGYACIPYIPICYN